MLSRNFQCEIYLANLELIWTCWARMAAKGVLIVDPIQSQSLSIYGHRPDSQYYILFQYGTLVQRTNKSRNFQHQQKWYEDSQVRFDIGPGTGDAVEGFVLERAADRKQLVPQLVGKVTIPINSILVERRADRWFKVEPSGMMHIEFTFYPVAPLLPKKAASFSSGRGVQAVVENVPKSTESSDKVFEEVEPAETGRLHRMAHRLKQKYRRSAHGSGESLGAAEGAYDGSNLLSAEVELPLAQAASEDCGDLALRRQLDFSSYEFQDELESVDVPFSAGSIGLENGDLAEQLRQSTRQQLRQSYRDNYVPIAAESFQALTRIDRAQYTASDFKIDPGLSFYSDNAKWSRVRVAHETVPPHAPRPKLPPKIPIGMSFPEYAATNGEECRRYLKSTIYGGT